MAMALLFSTTQIILVPLNICCSKNDQSTVPIGAYFVLLAFISCYNGTEGVQ